MALDPARRRRGAAAVDEGHRPARASASSSWAARRTTGRWACPGPGGPCSEILYDRGPEHGPDGGVRDHRCGSTMPPKLEDRYLEIWNLVFMQDELSAVRSKDDFDIAGPLPKKNIDTGMGLERVAFLLQGVDNMYEIDVMYPVIEKAEELTGRTLRREPRRRRPLPGGRRPRPQLDDADRRRRHARQRGPRLRAAPAAAPRGALDAAARLRGPRAARAAAGQPRQDGRDLHRARTATGTASRTVAYAEEDAFRQTLRSGTTIFDHGGRAGEAVRRHDRCSGDQAFALHDTYGFPIDLTLEMAAEQGLEVDEDGFRRLMGEQRERATRRRAREEGPARRHRGLPRGRRRAWAAGSSSPATTRSSARAASAAWSRDGEVGAVGARGRRGRAGARPHAVLRRGRRPARRPGRHRARQRRPGRGPRRAVADHRPDRAQGARCSAARSRRACSAHVRGRRRAAQVDLAARTPRPTWCTRRSARRWARPRPRRARRTRRAASGSTSPRPARCPVSVMQDVEARVNDLVLADLAVHAEIDEPGRGRAARARWRCSARSTATRCAWSPSATGRASCAAAPTPSGPASSAWSSCSASRSIGSGVRRVEALVGADAYRFLAREHVLVAQLSEALKARPEELPERVNDIVERLRAAEKEIEQARIAAAARRGRAARRRRGRTSTACAWSACGSTARAAATCARWRSNLRSRLSQEQPGAAVIVGVDGRQGRRSWWRSTTPAARARGQGQRRWCAAVTPLVGGTGGGKDDVAQGGGTDASRIDEALAAARDAVAAGRRAA